MEQEITQGIIPEIKEVRRRMDWGEATDRSELLFWERDMQEYLLVIHPDMEVYSKVLAEKQLFYECYGQPALKREQEPQMQQQIPGNRQASLLLSDPSGTALHISLAGFMAKESMEDTLIRWIQRVCSRQQGFGITLNNYSGMPPHTIYLRVQDHLPFHLLIQKLLVINEYIQSNGCPAVRWASRPHLNISGKISEAVYEQAVMDYSKRIFHETFSATELVLLRRSHAAASFKIVNVFGLRP